MLPMYDKIANGRLNQFLIMMCAILVSYQVGKIILNENVIFLALLFASLTIWITFYILGWGINELRWLLFAVLLFLWVGNISVLHLEIGRVRLLFGGILAILFIPLDYSKGIRNILKRRQTLLAFLLILLMSISWLIFGKRDVEIIRDCIPLFMTLVWVTMLIKSPKDLELFKLILLIMILALGITGIIFYLTGGGINYRLSNLGGKYKDPNDVAYTFCLLMPVAVSYLVHSMGWRKKAFAFVIIVISTISIIATGSRAGSLILVCIFIVTIGVYLKKKPFSIMFLLLGIAFTILLAATQFSIFSGPIDRIASISSIDFNSMESIPSMDSRLPAQARAIKLWWKNPIIGIGYSNFSFDPYKIFRRTATHNTYLQLLVELGIIGFALYILLLIFIFKGFSPHWVRSFGLATMVFGLISLATNTVSGMHLLYLFAPLSGAVRELTIQRNLTGRTSE